MTVYCATKVEKGKTLHKSMKNFTKHKIPRYSVICLPKFLRIISYRQQTVTGNASWQRMDSRYSRSLRSMHLSVVRPTQKNIEASLFGCCLPESDSPWNKNKQKNMKNISSPKQYAETRTRVICVSRHAFYGSARS